MIQLLTDKFQVCKTSGQPPNHPKVGTYETLNISLNKLKDLQFTEHQFLLSGFLPKKSGRYKGKSLALSLSKHNTKYVDNQITMVADIDGKWFDDTQQIPETAKGVHELLITLNPLLKDIKFLIKPSSSSGLHKIGEEPKFTSWHVYAQITNVAHLKDWAEKHHYLCFDNGWGNIVHSKGADILSRSLFDLAIYSSQRPIFEAPAIVTDGYAQVQKPEAGIFGTEPLDLMLTKPKPETTDSILDDLKDEYSEYNDEYLAFKDEYKRQYPDRARLVNGGSIELTAKISGNKTVVDLLIEMLNDVSPQGVGMTYCQDPLEPHEGKGRASLIWLGANTLYIHSFLHGQRRFNVSINFSSLANTLKAEGYDWKLAAKLLYRLVDPRQSLAQRINPIKSSISSTFTEGNTNVKVTEKQVQAYLNELQTAMAPPSDIYEVISKQTGFDKYSAVYNGAGEPLYVHLRQGEIIFNNNNTMKERATNKKVWVETMGAMIDGFTALRFSENRVEYEKIVLDPSDQHAPDELNLWGGFAAVPEEGDPQIILDFILEVICDGNKTNYNHLLHWLADFVQNPHIKPSWAVYLVSKAQGTGKGTLQKFVADIVGFAHVCKFKTVADLSKQFDALYTKSLFAYMEEMIVVRTEDKQIVKDMITEKMAPLSQKFKDESMINQYQRHMHASNSIAHVPKDRRSFVLKVGEKYAVGHDEYWRKLYSWWEDENGMNIFMYFLKNMKIGPLPLRAPVTRGAWVSARESIGYENPYIEALFRIVFINKGIHTVDGFSPLHKYIHLDTILNIAKHNTRSRVNLDNATSRDVTHGLATEDLSFEVVESCKKKSPVAEIKGSKELAIGIEINFELMLGVCKSIAALPEFDACTTLDDLQGVINEL